MFLLERRRLTELDEVGMLGGYLNENHAGQPTECYSDHWALSLFFFFIIYAAFLGVGSWAQCPGCPIPSLLKAHHDVPIPERLRGGDLPPTEQLKWSETRKRHV